MKNLNKIIIAFIVLVSIFACNKDEQKDLLSKETISAKWVVNGTSEYKSFEFNKSGNYIIEKSATTKSTNDVIVLTGTYNIIDKSTIVLSDFGTLIISEINDNSISFSIKPTSNPENAIDIIATKQEEVLNTPLSEKDFAKGYTVDINSDNIVDITISYVQSLTVAGSNKSKRSGIIIGPDILYREPDGTLFLSINDTIRKNDNANSEWLSGYHPELISITQTDKVWDSSWSILSKLSNDYFLAFKIRTGDIEQIGWLLLEFNLKSGEIIIKDKEITSAEELIIKK
jgi:hypothetical protein